MKRKLLKIFVCSVVTVLLVAGVIFSQITSSTPSSFTLLPNEFDADNLQGAIKDWVTVSDARIDTLSPIQMNITVRDTIGDSLSTIFNVSWRVGTNAWQSEMDTLPYCNQLWFPHQTGGTGGVRDSIFGVVFKQDKFELGAAIRIEISPVDVNTSEGFLQLATFAEDTLRGTLPDTSYAMYIGHGAKISTLGVKFLFGKTDSTGVVFMPLYDAGYGWGFNIADTLADSTWTVGLTQDSWGYRKAGELTDAKFMKIVLFGKTPADTSGMKILLRIKPE